MAVSLSRKGESRRMCPLLAIKAVWRDPGPRRVRPEALRVWLLGSFRVAVGSRVIEEDPWSLRKAAGLIKARPDCRPPTASRQGRQLAPLRQNGVKRSLLVEASGGPLSVVIAGANVADFKLLEAIVIERPQPSQRAPQHLCLDKGYDKGPALEEAVESRDYISYIWRIGEEKLEEAGEKRYPARRWVVERTLGWLSKSRAILIRKEGRQLPGTHQGRLYLAVVPSSAPLVPIDIVT